MTSLFFFIHLAVLATLWESVNFSLRLSTIALKNSQLKNPLFIPNLIYRNLLLVLLLFYAISSILLPDNVSGFLAVGIGCLFMANLKEFHYWDLLRFPAFAVYYLLQLIGGMGYFYLGYCQLSQQSLLIAQGVILSYLVGLLSLYLLWQRHKFSLTK
ncbi:hypothetical protein [Lonepinella sp. BR2919]|uniref:hypothetical protein n=1 Tax=unclassified Lonepinella TaxID=2642006 RepID=UPI003F6E1ED5